MSGLLHAEGPIDDRTLCGIAYEGTYDDSFVPPATAGFGEVVTCDDCQKIITYCQEGFTSRFLKRRAALSKAKGEAPPPATAKKSFYEPCHYCKAFPCQQLDGCPDHWMDDGV